MGNTCNYNEPTASIFSLHIELGDIQHSDKMASEIMLKCISLRPHGCITVKFNIYLNLFDCSEAS